MYYYTDPRNLVGVDPWPSSIEKCAGLPGRFLVVDEVPSSFPVADVSVAFAFSVFTHLSSWR